MRRLLTAGLLSAGLLLTACGTAGVDNAAAPSTSRDVADGGEVAPAAASGDGIDLDFTAETIAGKTFDPATTAGSPTVFWFWAPWCPTCRAQIDGVSALADTFGDDVNVIGVGALDDQGAIADFAGDVSSNVVNLNDPDGAVWRHFGVTTQSSYLVVDANGVAQASGYLDDAELSSLVSDLVG